MKLSKPLIFVALEFEARALAGCGPVQVVGLRACRLPKNLAERNPSCIIMAGIAGALDPALKIGDIVIDDPDHLCPPTWRRGPIHTAESFIHSPADKATLFRTGAVAVEMENALVRRAAAAANIPFIGLRCISDTAEKIIDPAVLSLTDDLGRINARAVAGLLLRRPWIMPQLTRLKSDSQRALRSLASALNELLK